MHKFECDMCGNLGNIDDNNILTNTQRDRKADLCNSCADEVVEWIVEQRKEKETMYSVPEPTNTLDDALKLLKLNGYVAYKPPAHRAKRQTKK